MKLFRALVAIVGGTIASEAAEPGSTKSPADAMREMRTLWLQTVPEKGSYKSADEVVAVAMDWPMGEHIVTVLSSSGGDASLYTTSGFGILGGIGHESVRKAAAAFVHTAQQHLKSTAPTTDFPYPDTKTLRFYMVTASGVRVVSFSLTDIEKSGSQARTLFAAGQEVVTQLRLISPQK